MGTGGPLHSFMDGRKLANSFYFLNVCHSFLDISTYSKIFELNEKYCIKSSAFFDSQAFFVFAMV